MKKLALTVTLLGLWVTKAIQAAEFFCSSGDVSCLIAAINKANRNGKENTIVLEPGNYVLVAADHIDTDSGATGLPPVSGNITITGVGADSTVIERDAVASTPFRIFSIAVSGNLKFDGITIKGGLNHIDFTGGGGILNRGILTVANSIIFDNQARLGGGIFNLGGTLTIMNSIVLQNTGGGLGDGGGILSVDGTVTVNNSTIASNDVLDGPGGGISNLSVEGIGTMTITNSTISDNFGGDTIGGGITNSGTMTINNSTIARNVASVFFGGGIWNSGTLAIMNSTISANRLIGPGGGEGGGIFNFSTGSVELANVILAMNTAGGGPDCSGRITSRGNNLLGDLSGCQIDLLKTDLVGDPGLGEFNDDAPPGHAHFPLLASSQAIDRGNPEACPETDQLGNPRVGTCDIGAVEFQGILVSIDIRPRSDANRINPNSTNNINVAILSGNGFDARTIDPNTVRFGATGTEAAPINVGRRDVDGDGDRDLVLRFQIQDTGIRCGDTSAVLTGQISGGPSIIGSNPIRTVLCGK